MGMFGIEIIRLIRCIVILASPHNTFGMFLFVKNTIHKRLHELMTKYHLDLVCSLSVYLQGM